MRRHSYPMARRSSSSSSLSASSARTRLEAVLAADTLADAEEACLADAEEACKLLLETPVIVPSEAHVSRQGLTLDERFFLRSSRAVLEPERVELAARIRSMLAILDAGRVKLEVGRVVV